MAVRGRQTRFDRYVRDGKLLIEASYFDAYSAFCARGFNPRQSPLSYTDSGLQSRNLAFRNSLGR